MVKNREKILSAYVQGVIAYCGACDVDSVDVGFPYKGNIDPSGIDLNHRPLLNPLVDESDSYLFRSERFQLGLMIPDKKGTDGFDESELKDKLYSKERAVGFQSELRGLNQDDPFNHIGDVDAICFKYLWNVPVSKREEDRGLSLYDHVRLNAARAAIDGEYLLIGGDLSGIQAYIDDAAGFRSSGAARRLRARSFKLQVLVKGFTDRFVRNCGLSPANILVENGGNLLILVPDSEDITKKVDLAQEAFDKYFYNVSFMETSMNLASLKISETDLSYPGWRDTYDRLQIELMKRKQTKFANILTTDQHPHVIPKTLYDPKPEFYRSADEYGERSPLCRNCGKHHKDEVPGDEDDPQNCNYCNEDKRLGSIIVKDCNYIEFGEKGRFEDKDSTNQERKDFTIDLGDFSFDFRVAIVPEKDAGISSIRLLGKFSESVEGRFTTLSNWVPYFNEDKFGKYVPTDYVLEPGEVEPKLDGLITFDLLMSYRPGGGVDYMGVLKADVDNLGKFLMDDKGCFKDGSAAKYFGFSRYLDLFFSGWLRGKLAEGDAKSACIPFDASDIYTIFAGGDDLALVGRWDDLLVLANLIYTKFKNYVCDNKELTMSFGYVAVAPKYPISEAIHGAEEKLKEAKNFVHDKSNANHEPEKDSIKAFDCIFKNGLLVELLPDGNLLATAKRDESDRDDNRVMNPAMLHRFLGYQESAVKSQKYNSNKMSEIEKSEFHPNHLIYRARVSYELERNLRKGKDESKLVADSELKRVNDLLKNVYFEDKGTKHFKFPLTWAAYRNR